MKAESVIRRCGVRLAASAMLVAGVLLTGCNIQPQPYVYRRTFVEGQADIVRGAPNAFFDKGGHYFWSMPYKLIYWEWTIGNHSITQDTEDVLRAYVELNDLYRVRIRLNEYAPFDDFSRLCGNQDVGVAYRFTFGLYFWLYQTIIPGRVFAGMPFAGDTYNPWTNTVHIYSGQTEYALRHVALAKYYSQREHPGTSAMARFVPFVDTYQDKQAARDVIGYLYARRYKQNELDGYGILCAQLGSSPGESLAKLVGPLMPVVQTVVTIPSTVVGHMMGNSQAKERAMVTDPPLGSELTAGVQPSAVPESAKTGTQKQ